MTGQSDFIKYIYVFVAVIISCNSSSCCNGGGDNGYSKSGNSSVVLFLTREGEFFVSALLADA